MFGIKEVVVVLLLSCSVYADNVSIFSDEKVHKMAIAYKTMVERPENFDILKNIPTILDSSEFKGYVAGMLDTQEMFAECAKTHGLKDIAYKTALMINTLDINKSASYAITMLVGVKFACDDETWKHK